MRPPNMLRTTSVGVWNWNEELFRSKIVKDPQTGCDIWQGAMTVNGPLFGVNKNSKPQMTQACRVAWMSHYREEIEERAIYHSCNNKQCVNPEHLRVTASNRHGHKGRNNQPLTGARKLHKNHPNQWVLSFNIDPEQNPINTKFKQAMQEEIAPHEIARHGLDVSFGYHWITISEELALKLILKYPEYQQFMRKL